MVFKDTHRIAFFINLTDNMILFFLMFNNKESYPVVRRLLSPVYLLVPEILSFRKRKVIKMNPTFLNVYL